MNCNMFTGLHGRSLPAATGARLANPELTVLVESGDGCSYGEGGNHFLAALRRNVNLTLLAHDNQIYGLTKGQASPTTMQGMKTKAQPFGQPSMAFNPVAVAVAMQAGFVARGFSGETEHLAGLIQEAVRHKGFSLVDILQPCVSFNKVNTFGWYKERVYKLGPEHDPTDFGQAMERAREFGERIPIGVLYRNDRPPLEANMPALAQGPLTIGGFTASGEAATAQKNISTVGRIPNGAVVERGVPFKFNSQESMTVSLNEADFTTVMQVVNRINSNLGGGYARAQDASTIELSVPDKFRGNMVPLMASLENMDVSPAARAKVVVAEKSGTVVVGSEVRLSRVAVAHGNLQIVISENPQVSQPGPFSQGKTVVTPQTNVAVHEQNNRLMLVEGATLQELVDGLNAIGATPRDLISNIRTLKSAGALHADLEVI
jgi:2-oxoacid:acceptor oxidoreductase beta subunit (pyruvate/2-ketoisovalerate family)